MYIFEAQFNLKPDAVAEEMLRLFNELAVPIFRKIPGLISMSIYKYSVAGDNPPEWEYAWVEVWESKEAHGKAIGKYIGDVKNSELAKTGYYDKFLPMMEKYSMAFATPIASSK